MTQTDTNQKLTVMQFIFSFIFMWFFHYIFFSYKKDPKLKEKIITETV